MFWRRMIFPLLLAAATFWGGNFVAAKEAEKSDGEPRYLVAVGYDFTDKALKIYDAMTGVCVKDFDSLDFGHRPIRPHTQISFSADGKRLIVPTANHTDNPEKKYPVETVFVIDVDSGKILRDFGRESGDQAVISPDGKFVVSMIYEAGYPDVKLWEVETGKLLKTWKHPNESGARYKGIAFSHDGKNVAAYRGGDVQIWEVPSGKAVATLNIGGGGHPLICHCFSPDGKYLGTSNGVWEIKTRECQYRLDGTGAFAWSPDGKYVVKGENWVEGTCSIHDARTGKKIKELSPDGINSWSADWSPDGKYIAFGQWDGNVSIYDVKNDKFVSRFGYGKINTVAFVPFSAKQIKILEKRGEAAELLVKGVDYLKVGQKKMAVDELKKAVAADETAWEADFVLGLVEAFSNQNVVSAHAAFARCEKKTKDAEVLNNFAVTSVLRGKYADALGAWETLAEMETPPEAAVQNVGVMMDRVNRQQMKNLDAKTKKRLVDLHVAFRKKAPDGYDDSRGWMFMPLEGVTDNEECGAFFTKKAVKGKVKEGAYEWK